MKIYSINIEKFVGASNFGNLFKKKARRVRVLIFSDLFNFLFMYVKKKCGFLLYDYNNYQLQNCVCRMGRQGRVSCNCAVTRGNCEAANLASAIQLSGVKDLAATTASTGANAINP